MYDALGLSEKNLGNPGKNHGNVTICRVRGNCFFLGEKRRYNTGAKQQLKKLSRPRTEETRDRETTTEANREPALLSSEDGSQSPRLNSREHLGGLEAPLTGLRTEEL